MEGKLSGGGNRIAVSHQDLSRKAYESCLSSSKIRSDCRELSVKVWER